MAKFNGFILTEKGRELLAKGLAGETITFTKMAIGDGTSLTSERERTSLVNQITTLPILNINVKRNGTCEINALLTNKSVTTGFYIKELGIFAHGNDNVEILYAYNISTSPDFVPPFSANNVVEIEYVDTIIVDQVANVTAVIDPSITYITKKYADENYLVSSRLAEILGLQFGGNIQDIGNKTKGKFYYDSVTKFYYECIEDNSLTYNDSGKFRAISNKPISDKLENLFEKGSSYCKIGDLIIQGGIVNYRKTDGADGTVGNFTIPFKNDCFSVVSSDVWNGTNRTSIAAISRTQFRCWGKDGADAFNDTTIRWLAVGY
nr:MAG TPA: tail collar fiber protein [Caudoviricetes sp.]